MEVFKLTSSFTPGNAVRGFDSFMWTERYDTYGEFKIIYENDIKSTFQVPIDSLISHTDTKEVMVVENYRIKRDKKKKLFVEISGRSFETFGDERTTVGSKQPMFTVANEAIVELVTGTPAENVARNIFRYALEPGFATADDAIANLVTRLSIREPDVAMDHIIKRGGAYTRASEFLGIAKAGVRTIRPNGAQTTMDIVIHDGLDKTATVTFSAQKDDLIEPEYIWSIKGFKTHAQVATKFDSRLYLSRDIVSVPTGRNRRVLYLEADDLEGDYTPGTSTDVLASRAQSELDQHIRKQLMAATVSPSAAPKFKWDYDIGDLVTASGEFSLTGTMRVVEHILTVDRLGIQGFPALSAV